MARQKASAEDVVLVDALRDLTFPYPTTRQLVAVSPSFSNTSPTCESSSRLGLGSCGRGSLRRDQVEAPPLHVGDSKVRNLDVGRIVLLPNVFGDTANDSRDVPPTCSISTPSGNEQTIESLVPQS